jgi:hypothetical protein
LARCDVRFALEATEFLLRREMTRCADFVAEVVD